MRKVLIILMVLATIRAPAEEDHPHTPSTTAGSAAAHGAYDTVAISMMIWGTGLAVGIALLTGLLDQSKSSNGGGNGGNGGNGHAHTTNSSP